MNSRSPRNPASQEDHFQRLARLLELESAAEARQMQERSQRQSAAEAERTGTSLVDLVVIEEHSGLGGRCILSLVKRNRSLALPWTRLQSGAPVLLSSQDEPGGGWRGVVCDRADRVVRVALNEPPEGIEEATCRIDLSSDEVARLRQRAALERARTAGRDRLAELRQVLLGETDPSFGPPKEFTPLDLSLNESQREAIQF